MTQAPDPTAHQLLAQLILQEPSQSLRTDRRLSSMLKARGFAWTEQQVGQARQELELPDAIERRLWDREGRARQARRLERLFSAATPHAAAAQPLAEQLDHWQTFHEFQATPPDPDSPPDKTQILIGRGSWHEIQPHQAWMNHPAHRPHEVEPIFGRLLRFPPAARTQPQPSINPEPLLVETSPLPAPARDTQEPLFEVPPEPAAAQAEDEREESTDRIRIQDLRRKRTPPPPPRVKPEPPPPPRPIASAEDATTPDLRPALPLAPDDDDDFLPSAPARAWADYWPFPQYRQVARLLPTLHRIGVGNSTSMLRPRLTTRLREAHAFYLQGEHAAARPLLEELTQTNIPSIVFWSHILLAELHLLAQAPCPDVRYHLAEAQRRRQQTLRGNLLESIVLYLEEQLPAAQRLLASTRANFPPAPALRLLYGLVLLENGELELGISELEAAQKKLQLEPELAERLRHAKELISEGLWPPRR